MAESKEASRTLSKLATMAKGKTVLRAATWPGAGLPLQLRVVSCSEVQICHSHAIAHFVDVLKIPFDNVVTVSLFEDEVMTHLLFHACRDPENAEKTFAENVDDLRENTTPDQRAEMYNQYRDLQQEVDPAPVDMTADLLAEVLEAIKKKDRVILRRFGSCVLANYLLITADQLVISPTGN